MFGRFLKGQERQSNSTKEREFQKLLTWLVWCRVKCASRRELQAYRFDRRGGCGTEGVRREGVRREGLQDSVSGGVSQVCEMAKDARIPVIVAQMKLLPGCNLVVMICDCCLTARPDATTPARNPAFFNTATRILKRANEE